MSYLIIGTGQLGKEFQRFFKSNKLKYEIVSHDYCDISSLNELNSILKKEIDYNGIKTIINCAAYNNVTKAETDRDNAFRVNAIGPKNLAILSNKYNLNLVHFSTDYVFGNTNSNYIFRTEYDETNPISFYGFSKLKGEEFIKDHCNNFLILRTSWLYGSNGNNFIDKILQKVKNRENITLPSNVSGIPTYTKDLVAQTNHLLNNNCLGLYHAANEPPATSWYVYCKKIFRILNIQNVEIKKEIVFCDNIRPINSVLLNSMLKLEKLNIMRNWEIALEDYLKNDMVQP